jgi:hypothetical protein
MMINVVLAILVIAIVSFAIFRPAGRGGRPNQTASSPSATNAPAYPRWQFWRTPGMWTRGRSMWLRGRVRVRETVLNYLALGILGWCVWELFPGTRHLYIGRSGAVLAVMALLIGTLGVGWFRGTYGQVMCPKNYLFPLLFIVTLGLLVFVLFRG